MAAPAAAPAGIESDPLLGVKTVKSSRQTAQAVDANFKIHSVERCPDYRKLSVFQFLMLHKGTAVQASMMPTLVGILITCTLCVWKQFYPRYWIATDGLGHQLLIIPLAFLMVVRTNLAYDRWWNGRLAIGKVVYHCRQLATKTMNYIDGDDPEVPILRRTMLQYVYVCFVVIRHNLQKRSAGRRGDPREYSRYLTTPEREFLSLMKSNRPVQVISWMRSTIRHAAKHLTVSQLIVSFDEDVSGVVQAWQQAATICSTPMPMPYAHLLNVLQYAWVYTVPIPLCTKLDSDVIGPWATPFVVGLISVTMFGLDAIGSEIEDPFGDDFNDIPVEDMQKTVLDDTGYISYNMDLFSSVERVKPTIPFKEKKLERAHIATPADTVRSGNSSMAA